MIEAELIEGMDLVDLEYVQIYFDKPIVYFLFKEGAELGFPEIRELTVQAEKLSNGRPYFSLSDARVNINLTPEGKRIAAEAAEHPLNRGTAVIVKNELYKIAVNFFSHFGKLNYPYKAFTDKEKAKKWLLSQPL